MKLLGGSLGTKSTQSYVEVKWLDAWADTENFATAHGIALTHKPMLVRTRGWLIVDDEVGVSVAAEDSLDDGGDIVYRGRTFIPRLMIQSVEPFPPKRTRSKKRSKLPQSHPEDSSPVPTSPEGPGPQ